MVGCAAQYGPLHPCQASALQTVLSRCRSLGVQGQVSLPSCVLYHLAVHAIQALQPLKTFSLDVVSLSTECDLTVSS